MEKTKLNESGRGHPSGDDNPWAKSENDDGTKRPVDPTLLKFDANATVTIRILPNKDSGAKPFFKYEVLWVPQRNQRQGAPIIRAIGDYNKVDEYINTLWLEWNEIKEGHGGDKEAAKQSKEGKKCLALINEHKAKMVVDMNVIVRETGEVKKLCANRTIFQGIMDYANNPEYGNPSDEKHGYDFKIITTTEPNKPMTRKYAITAGRKETPLTPEEIKLIATAPKLERTFTSEEEAEKIVQNAREIIVMPNALKEPKENPRSHAPGNEDEGLVLDRPE